MSPLRDATSRALREPLLHFVVVGAIIFGLFEAIGAPPVSEERDRIVVSAGDIKHLAATWQSKWQRPPTPDELQGLVDELVREEVLYREALAMGLDRDDEIVRRRLAQKLEFLVDDLMASQEPTDAEIAAYFEASKERYRLPLQLSFTQVFFSTDRRGAAAERDAELALITLRGGDAKFVDARIGDPTLLEGGYQELSVTDIEAGFGPGFAEALAGLPVGIWSGPVESPYGVHLVRVYKRVEGRVPALEEIRDRVRNDWKYERRQAADEEVYERMLSRYDVSVEPIFSDEGHRVTVSSETGAVAP